MSLLRRALLLTSRKPGFEKNPIVHADGKQARRPVFDGDLALNWLSAIGRASLSGKIYDLPAQVRLS
jgi:hypothetical protein